MECEHIFTCLKLEKSAKLTAGGAEDTVDATLFCVKCGGYKVIEAKDLNIVDVVEKGHEQDQEEEKPNGGVKMAEKEKKPDTEEKKEEEKEKDSESEHKKE